MTRPQLILTWVSWSWKSTILTWLLSTFPTIYWRPIQYTTRKPRSEAEKDEYVFLTQQQFLRKLINGDFIEYVEYNKELYAIGKYFDKNKTNIFIAEPVWREALKRYFKLNNIPFVAVFIEINKDEARRRLEGRGSKVFETDVRLKDFKYFLPSEGDAVIEWDYKPISVMNDVHKLIKWVS